MIQKLLCRLVLLTALLTLPLTVSAEVLGESAPPFLNTLAKVPLTLNLGDENLFASRLGLRASAALYPLPLLIDRQLNYDLSADVTYTLRGSIGNFLASSSVALYTGAGPRYRLVNSPIFLAGDEPGAYLGAGALAGADFRLGLIGLSLVSAFAEAGSDYIWQAGDSLSSGHWSPRVRLGLTIPLGIPLTGTF